MGNKTRTNLIGAFALFMTGLLLFGCASQPTAPVPNSTVCGTDRYLCQDGTYVVRNSANNCQFGACPTPTACANDTRACPDGSHVGRNPSKNCEFSECSPSTACTLEAKLCYDGSLVSRNSSRNCAFNACPAVIIPVQQNGTNQSNLAAEGETCAGAAAIKCQSGLQCITSGQPWADGACTAPAPASSELQKCTGDRYEFCTAEFNPVCGKQATEQAAFRDYPNPCEACSTRSNAIGYYLGTCENQ
ncbi:MAG: hypothetical protein WCT52_02765 [Candidatus Micrarchaeia archaeon]